MSIEKTYVQDVYDRIATDFSDTRYRTWTCVEDFLDSIPDNSNSFFTLHHRNVLDQDEVEQLNKKLKGS